MPAINWIKVSLGIAFFAILGFAVYMIDRTAYNRGVQHGNTEIIKYKDRIKMLTNTLREEQEILEIKYVTQYIKQVEYEDRIVYRNRDVIKTVVEGPDTVSKGFISVHNAAALGQIADPVLAADGTPSGIGDRALLEGVTNNYNICRINAVRLDNLQKWADETWKTIDEINRNRIATTARSVPAQRATARPGN